MREEDNLSKRLPSLGYTKAIPIGCVAHSRDVSGYDKAIFCFIVALGLLLVLVVASQSLD